MPNLMTYSITSIQLPESKSKSSVLESKLVTLKISVWHVPGSLDDWLLDAQLSGSPVFLAL